MNWLYIMWFNLARNAGSKQFEMSDSQDTIIYSTNERMEEKQKFICKFHDAKQTPRTLFATVYRKFGLSKIINY